MRQPFCNRLYGFLGSILSNYQETVLYTSETESSFGAVDTGQCDGPFACNVQACSMFSGTDTANANFRVARACPVELPSGRDAPSLTSVRTSCATCQECGQVNEMQMVDFGRGCANECSRLICPPGTIFDWTRYDSAMTLADRRVACEEFWQPASVPRLGPRGPGAHLPRHLRARTDAFLPGVPPTKHRPPDKQPGVRHMQTMQSTKRGPRPQRIRSRVRQHRIGRRAHMPAPHSDPRRPRACSSELPHRHGTSGHAILPGGGLCDRTHRSLRVGAVLRRPVRYLDGPLW